MREKKSKRNDYVVPIAVSAALHVVLVIALLWGADFTMSKPQPSGQMVQAVVIDPNLVKQQANQIRQQRESAAKKEQERLDKLRREAEQLEKNRKAEEDQLRKLKEQQARDAKAAREAEEARKQKEQEKKVAEEKERVAKLEAERKTKEEAIKKAEQERLAKEAAIAKAEQERIAKEKAAKEAEEKARREKEAAAKAEQERIAKEKAAKEAAEKARKEKERLERLERERKEQEAALNDIFAGLETESSQNSAARSQHVLDEKNRYGAIYTQLIQQRLLKDEYLLGKSCKVNIKLIPTGVDAIVNSVSILEGDTRVCNAAKSAILQVGSFPMPADDAVRQELRNINLTVDFE
ncbi:cell envelope integrity protein TolA [Vibrio vulnificus]|nr:cell envelope integrity protein TolA [Vibrio vulnificus]ELN6896451.1 cell envelope integrity protein TolA [Vibrio vulnificus]HDY7655119.1 cell envelope integrity protein TolA [Vibrio vulnificus]HDY7937667.1 cell envelope integrity protein TolA [Vibrio vulnificus]